MSTALATGTAVCQFAMSSDGRECPSLMWWTAPTTGIAMYQKGGCCRSAECTKLAKSRPPVARNRLPPPNTRHGV